MQDNLCASARKLSCKITSFYGRISLASRIVAFLEITLLFRVFGKREDEVFYSENPETESFDMGKVVSDANNVETRQNFGRYFPKFWICYVSSSSHF